MSQSANNKALQSQIVAQWITSLAISVVCCAILFIVFAGYIVDLHDSGNLISVKLELLQERHALLQSEVAALKRAPTVQINGVTGMPQAPVSNGAAPSSPPVSPEGVQISEPEIPAADVAPKEEPLMPVLNHQAEPAKTQAKQPKK